MRALIIEDNADVAGNIIDYLTLNNYQTDYACHAENGLNLIKQHTFDVIILDINLPKMDGFTFAHKLRTEHQIHTPILMLTARDSLSDKEAGYQAGAWDYLVKPFALKELLLRLNALLLRQQANKQKRLTVNTLSIDLENQHAFRNNKKLKLHHASIQILELLMRSAPNTVKREDLIYLLWNDTPPESDPLRSHIHELRREMDKPFEYPLLETVRGLGYRLVFKENDAHETNEK